MHHKTLDSLRMIVPLLLCACLSCFARGKNPDMVVFSNGQARCYLDLSGAQALSQTQADRLKLGLPIGDLSTYFKRMTGKPLPRTPGKGLVPLRLELKEYPANVSKYDAPTVQGFEIIAGPQEVRLQAYTKLGLANAIYYLLDRWGCRWVMPGELGECIPKRDKLTIPTGKTSFAPRSDMAVEVPGTGRAPKWSRRNMAGWEYWINAQHFWFYAIPPKANLNPKYYWYYDANGVRITDPKVKTESNFEKHPEWYSLLGGKRQPRQLCTSNPEVIARMIKVAKEYLGGDTNPPTFPIDPEDLTDFCECDKCVALDVPGALTDGVPSVTDRVLTFANAVADGIKDEFPDRKVAFCAYMTHIDPPEKVKPADNVIVLLCRTTSCLVHLTPTPNCPKSNFHDLSRRWRNLTPNVYTYEYDPPHWSGELPCPNYLEMARSLKYQLKDLGVKGSISDATMAGSTSSASWYINHYMARRMKVDPDRDPEEVLRDMCEAFFGPAAEPMESYYLELARGAAESKHPGTNRIGGGVNFYHEMFSPQTVGQAREHLDKAMSLVTGKELYEKRVKMVDMSHRHLEAWLGGLWAAQEHRYKDAVAAFDRMDQVINELDSHGYIAADDARHRARALRMKPLAENFPTEMGFITSWKLLGPFDNSDLNGHRRDPFEPVSSLSAPVKLADGKQARWWNYESPNGGFLNLEQAFADKRGDWQLSYGYAAINYNAPRAMEAKLVMDSFFLFKVYVNGKEVFSKNGENFDHPDKYSIKVNLKAGANVIVIKASHTSLIKDVFPWGLHLRVLEDK